jgi:hypothetical protein
MAEPALRRGDVAAGHLRASIAGVSSDQDLSGVRFVRGGEIEVRRQERARLLHVTGHELRHVEDADQRVLLGQIGECQDRVGGAQVDADRVALVH